MVIQELIDSLNEEQYKELEKIVIERLELRRASTITIQDFINKFRHDMSVRLINALKFYSQYHKYLEELNRNKFSNVPHIGYKTLTELDNLLKDLNYNLENYYKGRQNPSSFFHKGVGFYK